MGGSLCFAVRPEKGPLDHQLLIYHPIIHLSSSRRRQGQVVEVELHGLGDTVDELQSEAAVVLIRHLDGGDARVRADLLHGPRSAARRQSSLLGGAPITIQRRELGIG